MRTEMCDGKAIIFNGDCLIILDTLDECSMDSVVCDPPYGLGFMNKGWDAPDNIAFRSDIWVKVLRVLKPGGHLLAFSGTRTYHRMVCAIEDAGFEIRDQIGWAFGNGFPKSHDVSKGIDKAAGAEREVIGVSTYVSRRVENKSRPNTANVDGYVSADTSANITIPATDAAHEWQGWGTALKPAWEPICVARKPLSESTVAANVLRWRTGAINIDGCRVGTGEDKTGGGCAGLSALHDGGIKSRSPVDFTKGRWPANLVHDGSPEVLAAFPETTPSSIGKPRGAAPGDGWGMTATGAEYDDSGSAARFFYCAKASKADRCGSKHPTVKPIKLMKWLTKLVTPPKGLILDPFAGSGTTLQAGVEQSFRVIGIELEKNYYEDCSRRLSNIVLESNLFTEVDS